MSDNEVAEFIQDRSLKNWADTPRFAAGLRILRAGISQNEVNQLIKEYKITPDTENLEAVQNHFKAKHEAFMQSSRLGESDVLSRVLDFALDEIDAQSEIDDEETGCCCDDHHTG